LRAWGCRHRCRSLPREIDATGRSLAENVVKERDIGAAIHGERFAIGVAENPKTSLIKADGTSQSVSGNGIQEQQEFAALAVAGSVSDVVRIPDKLTKCQKFGRLTF